MATIQLMVNGVSVYTDTINDFGPALAHIEGYIASLTARMEEHNMALTQAQEERFNQISGMLTEFGSEVQAVLDAALSVQSTLETTIAGLQDQVTQLEADDTADANMIAALQQTISELQAASSANQDAVVAALDAQASQITSLDDAVGGDATTTPEPVIDEPVDEPVVDEPTDEFVVDDSGTVVPDDTTGAAG